MWGRRRKRGTRLSRLLALARLDEAITRAEQDPIPYPPAPDVPAARPSLSTQDVPVDNSAGPEAAEDPAPQRHQGLPVQRSRDGTRHGSFG
jgi:hypothetical protein